MDHTKLVIFLLIVLGTVVTFGSPITEDYQEEYSDHEELEEYPELSPDTKELNTLISDPDMSIFQEMAPNSKELEALLRSDPALGNYPEMVPNRKEIEALRMRSKQSNTNVEMTPEFQEQKELLSNSSGQDSKKVKRVDPGTIIAAATYGYGVVKSLLGHFSSIDRKIAIGIENESRLKWTAKNVYFSYGTSDADMPQLVKPGEALLWSARKTKNSLAGAVGVFTYCISDIKKTLAVMYSVPYNHFWYSNWWNVKLYDGCRRADKSIYEEMYYGNPFEGDKITHERKLGSNLKFEGSMTGSGQATLQIKVYS